MHKAKDKMLKILYSAEIISSTVLSLQILYKDYFVLAILVKKKVIWGFPELSISALLPWLIFPLSCFFFPALLSSSPFSFLSSLLSRSQLPGLLFISIIIAPFFSTLFSPPFSAPLSSTHLFPLLSRPILSPNRSVFPLAPAHIMSSLTHSNFSSYFRLSFFCSPSLYTSYSSIFHSLRSLLCPFLTSSFILSPFLAFHEPPLLRLHPQQMSAWISDSVAILYPFTLMHLYYGNVLPYESQPCLFYTWMLMLE